MALAGVDAMWCLCCVFHVQLFIIEFIVDYTKHLACIKLFNCLYEVPISSVSWSNLS
jgi:hypothetical protein